MKNLRDPKTKIYPSTMRGGKELPSSSPLDSPSVLSKLATPTPAIDPGMCMMPPLLCLMLMMILLLCLIIIPSNSTNIAMIPSNGARKRF